MMKVLKIKSLKHPDVAIKGGARFIFIKIQYRSQEISVNTKTTCSHLFFLLNTILLYINSTKRMCSERFLIMAHFATPRSLFYKN